ncbi:antigen [hydrocarbon metagenome]|uniref:Antigen n=1 Tax=hydrocarbon metagenome TaxID=938273 RepID=A0A0W8FK66_9ZZZZ
MAKQMQRASPAMVEKSLSGVKFPANRQDLIAKAQENNAEQSIIDTLRGLPERSYNSPIDISKAMGESMAEPAAATSEGQRGLAAASEETRERVAKMGGEASVSTATAVSAAEVQKYLKGIDYPTDKKGIVDQAQKNGAPNEVISILNRIDDQQYGSTTDVSRAIGKIL